MSRVYRHSQRDYEDWLHQKIWLSGNEQGYRKEYIPSFYNSLTRFMKRKGYTMDGRWGKGPAIVARWLYAIHVHEVARKESHKPLGYPEIIHRDWPEDRDVFDFEIDLQSIDEFMDSWKNVEDMDCDSRQGFRVKVELQTFLYTYVDIDNSTQGRRMARILEPSDTEDSDHQEEYSDLMSGAFGTTKKILGYNTI
jgi:hypothetical protein